MYLPRPRNDVRCMNEALLIKGTMESPFRLGLTPNAGGYRDIERGSQMTSLGAVYASYSTW